MFVHCSFIIRHLFVIRSSFVRLYVALVPPLEEVRGRFCSFIVRSLFVHCSFILRLLFVFCSSFLRYLFVFSSLFVYLPVRLVPFIVRLTFSVTTLPLLGSSLRIGKYVTGERIFCPLILRWRFRGNFINHFCSNSTSKLYFFYFTNLVCFI